VKDGVVSGFLAELAAAARRRRLPYRESHSELLSQLPDMETGPGATYTCGEGDPILEGLGAVPIDRLASLPAA